MRVVIVGALRQRDIFDTISMARTIWEKLRKSAGQVQENRLRNDTHPISRGSITLLIFPAENGLSVKQLAVHNTLG